MAYNLYPSAALTMGRDNPFGLVFPDENPPPPPAANPTVSITYDQILLALSGLGNTAIGAIIGLLWPLKQSFNSLTSSALFGAFAQNLYTALLVSEFSFSALLLGLVASLGTYADHPWARPAVYTLLFILSPLLINFIAGTMLIHACLVGILMLARWIIDEFGFWPGAALLTLLAACYYYVTSQDTKHQRMAKRRRNAVYLAALRKIHRMTQEAEAAQAAAEREKAEQDEEEEEDDSESMFDDFKTWKAKQKAKKDQKAEQERHEPISSWILSFNTPSDGSGGDGSRPREYTAEELEGIKGYIAQFARYKVKRWLGSSRWGPEWASRQQIAEGRWDPPADFDSHSEMLHATREDSVSSREWEWGAPLPGMKARGQKK
ncbi:hypothetical protein QBC47DRAFT_463257 [Echria macrotheca]|uniref:Uncharacterized protein n=1 Tax=Echria macrotheca TaxID=438768 RepID=A0AAJ0BB78_9PEZI|nr:hypothetical protein QBC47DRAFT_463257 [Echria macrotheca]